MNETVPRTLTSGEPITVSGLPSLTTQAYFVASHPGLRQRVVFWLTPTEDVTPLERLLGYWHTAEKTACPVWPLSAINPLRATLLRDHHPQIVLIDYATVVERLPSLRFNGDHELTLTVGQQLRPSEIAQRLVSLGYDFTGQASEPGYFARRGGILDVFPINGERPLRLEFSDAILQSIRPFDPVTKKTQAALPHGTVVAKKFPGRMTRASLASYLATLPDAVWIHEDTDEARDLIADGDGLAEELAKHSRLIFKNFDPNAVPAGFAHAPLYHNDVKAVTQAFKEWQRDSWQLWIGTQKPKELKALFSEKKIRGNVRYLAYLREASGFKNETRKILYLTDSEIFGEQALAQSPRKRVDQAFIMELKPGDYVVHLDHGIGRFTGMAENVVDQVTKEYFVVEYSEGDKLQVPVEMADKISKYIGVAHPKLHRLSGGQWYQLTRKVKQEARLLAQQLLKIYAKRELSRIKPFNKDTPEDIELAKSFPYKETPDQAKAIADVKSDLERETPMDRLICGDVGFGKTEVAVRAAFKAVMNRTQVALLSPTTILTQQHHDTFKERLKKFNVNVGILSRFETDKEQEDTLERLAAGTIDIVVGTHRLLSPDVKFKRLGLIIIDEEQRFGVKAKEKLKSLRAHAHVLTLTATPIPRTLNIALSGVRDVSIIETPPEGRLPIETSIEMYSDAAVKKCIEFELNRGGQAYFLHNKVETINFAGQELQKLIPAAKIGIAHGRLPEKELARAMQEFDTKQTNILLCSTIIENGLDLPNVNTLIVDNATNFGLAQLYQLRGRVGRGERQAFAYFFYHRKRLKGDAQKRLQALMEAKKLGSGFQLALRDLEIRGAGNILGKEQHGKVSAIGLSLYTRLLAQAIEELKFGKILEPVREILIDLPLEAYIPKEFLPEEERLVLYQKMANILRLEELHDLRDRIIRSRSRDEQRVFPAPILNLFAILEIRILAQKTDISHIDTTVMTDELGRKQRKLLLKFLFPLKAEQLAKLLHHNSAWQFTNDSVKVEMAALGDQWLEELKKTIRYFQHPEKEEKK